MVDHLPEANFNKLLGDSANTSAQGQANDETWQDKFLRETKLVGTGLTGFTDAASTALSPDHIGETAGKVAFSVAAGYALTRMAPQAGLTGLFARSAATGMGASFLYDVAGNGAQVANALSDNWQSDRNWQQNSAVMRNSLGHFAFDTTLMTAGGIGGGRLAELRALSLYPAQSGIPGFGQNGFLPSGDYKVSWQDFSKRYGTTPHRQELLANLEMVAGHIKNAGSTEITVGGSFVSSKPAPKDYDIAWSTEGVTREKLPPDLFSWHARSDTKLGLKGDVYPADTNMGAMGEWREALGQTRLGEPVGTVTIDLSTIKAKPTSPQTYEAWRAENEATRARIQESTRNQAAERKILQKKADDVMDALPQAIEGKTEGVVEWLTDFGAINERVRVDNRYVGQALVDAGYKPNARANDPLVKTDRQAASEWYIGQCLIYLLKGEPIPDVLASVGHNLPPK